MATEIDSSDNAQSELEAASPTVGSRLREERERQGLSEKLVADRLHITMHYVRAIETDGYEKLPGVVFARGYIKSYALLLGLNKDALIEQFDAMVAERTPESRTFIRPGRRSKKQNQVFIWLLIAVLAFLAGFLVFWSYNRFFVAESDGVTAAANGRFDGAADALAAGSVSIKLNQLDVAVTENIRIDNTARLQVSI